MTCVPLARAPAVGHGARALLGRAAARGGTLAHVLAARPGARAAEGSLRRGVEVTGGRAVNVEPEKWIISC